MRDLNDAIADVTTDIGQAQAQLAARGDQCRELIKEQEALHGRVRDDFNALARLQAEAATDAPPMLARDLLQQTSADLQRRDRKAAALAGELQALLDIEQSLQQRSQEAVAARDAAGGRWQALQDQVDTTLEAEPTYRALQDDLQLAVARADTVERMATSAQSEHDAKAGAYQADPIFMYLHRRNYGSTAYRGWPMVRTVDGWLAELCGFDRARREYATLVELPPYLQEHAGRARDDVEAARPAMPPSPTPVATRCASSCRRHRAHWRRRCWPSSCIGRPWMPSRHRSTASTAGPMPKAAPCSPRWRARFRPRAWTTCTAASPPPPPARTMPCSNGSMAVACAWARSTAWWLSTPVKWPC